MMMNCIRMSVLAFAFVVLGSNVASAVILVPAVVLSEAFDTPATGAANVSAAYPDYFLNAPVGTDANVASGRLELVKPIASTMTFLSAQTFVTEPLTVSADIGSTSTGGGGNDAVGLVIGNRAFVIFPDNGTLRPSIDTTSGGFPFQQNVGFNVDRNVMHHLEVVVTPNMSGGADFVISVTNGSSPFQTYTQPSYYDGGYVPGSVGFYNVYSTTNVGLYDNLEVIGLVEFVPPAPEPSSVMLLGMGAMVLVRARRRQGVRVYVQKSA
jgi:hypothetical protein